jgi:hypothetical protein
MGYAFFVTLYIMNVYSLHHIGLSKFQNSHYNTLLMVSSLLSVWSQLCFLYRFVINSAPHSNTATFQSQVTLILSNAYFVNMKNMIINCS